MGGAIHQVIVCAPVPSATSQDQVLCPAQGSQLYAPVSVAAYLLAPEQGAAFEANIAPLDYSVAGALWAFAFTTVVGLYIASHSIGVVLGFLRRG